MRFHARGFFATMYGGWESLEESMIKTIEAVFDGEALRPDEPLELAPNTRVRLTIEALRSSHAPMSFLRTARSLGLDGPADWSAKLEEYLYGGKPERG